MQGGPDETGTKEYKTEATVTEPKAPEGMPPTQTMEIAGGKKALKVIAEADISGNKHSPVQKEDSGSVEVPEAGFGMKKEYVHFIGKMNAKAAADYAEFQAHPEKYRLRDPENPDKYVVTTIHTCADGRCNPALYSDPSNPLQHFNLDWQPAAGLIYFPEVEAATTCSDMEAQLDADPALKAKIWSRLDGMYGPAIEQFFTEHEAGISSRYFIEQQAHWNKDHYPEHGCGAWGSNLVNAQKETIKNSVIVEKWLKETYPEEYEKGMFKVMRTIQDNSPSTEKDTNHEKNHVYDGEFIDSTLTSEEKGQFADLFEEAKGRFLPPAMEDPGNRIVRRYTGNPFHIDTAEHSEQGVRVSKFQWANTLNGQSAMEITWNDADLIAAHNGVLLNIIGNNNFSKAHPDKPHYIHLDVESGNFANREDYLALRKLMETDEALKARLNDGSLFLVVTETDRTTMKSRVIEDESAFSASGASADLDI